jgi:membrane-bound lytic murein transglycosylase MltF
MQFRKLFLLPVAILVASLTPIITHAQEAVAIVEQLHADQLPSPYDEEAMQSMITGLDTVQQEGLSEKEEKHLAYISERYKLPRAEAMEIINLAKEHAHPVFPKYEDILGTIEVESAYNRKAKSPGECLGLMQLKYVYHKATIRNKKDLLVARTNIRIASAYMNELFQQIKSNARGAVYSAFNTGPGAYRQGKRNRVYAKKVAKARANYA